MTLHPQRCNTCLKKDCPIYRNRWNRSEHKFIWEFGCASHSSVQEGYTELVGKLQNAVTRLELRKNHAHEQGNWEREDAMDEALTLLTGKEVWER